MIRILCFWNELRTRGWTIFLLGLKKYDKTDIFRLRSVSFSKKDFQKKIFKKLFSKEMVYLCFHYGVFCCCCVNLSFYELY
jgi:hypothetical protein